MDQNSTLIAKLPPDVAQQYERTLSEIRGELSAVEGISTIHQILTERVAIQYTLLQNMETQWPRMDFQRYNQLSDIFRKSMVELLQSYREIYRAGAANDLLAAKIFAIVSEVVEDKEVLQVLRQRILQTKGTVPVGEQKPVGRRSGNR